MTIAKRYRRIRSVPLRTALAMTIPNHASVCLQALMYICERAEAEIKLPVDWRLKVIIIGRTFFLHC